MSTYFPSVSLFFFSLSRKREKGIEKNLKSKAFRRRILNWVVCSTFHPSRRAINRRANTVGTFLINKSLRKINIGREFVGSWYRVLERERTNERTNGSEKETVKTITAEKIKRAGTTRSGEGREEEWKRIAEKIAAAGKKAKGWIRVGGGGRGRSRGIYIRVYICRERSERASVRRPPESGERARTVPLEYTGPLFPLSRYLFV